MRNLFAEYGYDQKEIDRRLQEIWDELFVGPDKIYYEVEDMGYVMDTGNMDVRTEGQSYAMMLSLMYGQKEVFDRVWKWTKKYMFMDYGKHAGYFAWSVDPSGEKNAHGPAPDGEEFFAAALLFASKRWGDGEGVLNYSKEARQILHDVIYNQHPMWNHENKLIKFVPELEFSDPSYHVPFFYDYFAKWSNEEDRGFWADAAKASREYLKIAMHEETGLNGEYADYDGTPKEWREHHHLFYSDSYRTAMNVGLDSSWHGHDEVLTARIDALQKFFCVTHAQDWDSIFTWDGVKVSGADYNMDDKVLHPVGLIATNAAASLAATDGPNARACVEKFWNTPLRKGGRRYYDNFLYAFSFLALSGNYRPFE